MTRFVGFAVVGASGLVVNQVALWFLTSKVGVYYLLSAVVATQISTIWNFALVERFVFDGGHEGRWVRLGWFALMNNIWLLLRTPFLYLLTTGAGLNYLISNALVLGAMTIVRFGIADNLIWADRSDLRGASAMRDGTRIWNYDIHGIVAITSESRLPELVRFQVPALPGPADIQVVVSNEGFGGLRRTIDVVEEGSTISYVEHLGRHGFATKIDVDTLAHIQVSKLLRRSPHVAYTNVVEPVVRWVMVRKGYILAHAACLQIDGHGVLITARTDTGKTTTCLKSIKEQGTGFVLRRHGDHRSSRQRAVLSEAADDLVAHPERGQGRADAPSHARVAAGAGSSALEVRPLCRDGVRQHQPARRLDERDRADDYPAAQVPGGPVDPQVEIVPSLTLDRLVVIERGDATLRELDTDEAFEILSENTEDAYGFPPYPRIGHALSNGEMKREQDIRRTLVEGLEAVLLRMPDRAWFEMLPRLAAGIGTAPGTALSM